MCKSVGRTDRERSAGGTHVTGQTLVLLHEALVLLVHLQHLADAVGRGLGLQTHPTHEESIQLH